MIEKFITIALLLVFASIMFYDSKRRERRAIKRTALIIRYLRIQNKVLSQLAGDLPPGPSCRMAQEGRVLDEDEQLFADELARAQAWQTRQSEILMAMAGQRAAEEMKKGD
jgi:hypothetical protein